MKKTLILLILFSFAIFLGGCHQKQPKKSMPIFVTAFRVGPKTIPADFQFVGVAKSSHPVEIRARVEGYIDSIDYVEGTMVSKDEQLFRIDPRPFEASLKEAKGGLARQEAILWRAERSLKRIEPLYEQNAASQKDRDNALAEVLAGEAAVIEARANVVKAELDLGYTNVTSPIQGLSSRAIYREGTLITPSINGLLTLVSVIDPIWVVFSVSDAELLEGRAEGEAAQLILPEEPNYSVSLQLADGSTFPYEGVVNFASPTLDPKTGSMIVRAQFPNPDGELLPGQFVEAIVSGAYRPDAIVVPQESVFQGRKGMYVFVINSDNTVSAREVETGEWYKNYWIINAGLEAGEEVVAEGINKVQNGAAVHVVSKAKFNDLETDRMR
ncbi:MAG: Multidrug resistance protein MdtE [Chlamydiae bacterium]|nr:Multidrug resistance protein MdtE [Chlamydiota bacterium]